jgi:hypothetical protein
MSRLSMLAVLSVCGAVVLLAEPRNDTVISRISPPPGFQRIQVTDGSFAASLRHINLKRPGTNAQVRGEDSLCGGEIVAVIAEPPLPTEQGKGAGGIVRLWGLYRWSQPRQTEIRFGLENGESAAWRDWRDGLRPRKRQGRILFVQVGVPDGSKTNYLRFLTFVAENAGFASLKRDFDIVLADDLAPGDIIAAEASGKAHTGFILDICRNAEGEKRFLIGMGGEDGLDFYIPRPYEPIQGDGAWFTLDGARYAVGMGQLTILRRFKLEP